jgi:hypothetical protein
MRCVERRGAESKGMISIFYTCPKPGIVARPATRALAFGKSEDFNVDTAAWSALDNVARATKGFEWQPFEL